MGASPHIVVVDDDPSILTLLGATLKAGLGARVSTYPSAEAALQAWSSLGEVALLLTDYSMPGATGLDLAAQVRARAPGLPIILLSAVEVPLEVPGLITVSLTKPCPPRLLLPRIRELLGLPAPPAVQAAPVPRSPSRLEALGATYRESLRAVPGRLDALAAAAVDEAGERALREFLHQLAGTAGSYGFPDITEKALALRVAVLGKEALGLAVRALRLAVEEAAAGP
jgi:CheY-like chemotaxis protein